MNLKEIDSLDLSWLKTILKDLKLYQSLKKELWKRWVKQYNKLKTWEISLSVEYYSALSEDYVLQESIKIFEKVFSLKDIKKDSIKLIKSEDISWWMRLFVEDKVLDLTYSKIEKQFS